MTRSGTLSHVGLTMQSMLPTGAPDSSFAELARRLAAVARAHGLDCPNFRAPPALDGARRTIRRYPDGSYLVSVQVRGRPVGAVAADLVEGVLVANHLQDAGERAEEWRRRLLGPVTAIAC